MSQATTTSVSHTPGPWHSEPAPRASSMRSIRTDSGKTIAFVNRGPAAEANERVLVAAPEMLTTLKDVIAHLRSITLDPGDDEDDAPALTAAEALIAKVEGRRS